MVNQKSDKDFCLEREQRVDRVKTWKQIDLRWKRGGRQGNSLHNSQLGGFHPLPVNHCKQKVNAG